MDVGAIVQDALIAVASLASAFSARSTHRARRALQHNGRKLDTLTDQILNKRIHDAVIEVLAKEEGRALRDLYRTVVYHRRVDDDRENDG